MTPGHQTPDYLSQAEQPTQRACRRKLASFVLKRASVLVFATTLLAALIFGAGAQSVTIRAAPSASDLIWSTMTPLPVARDGLGVAELGGLVFAVGGNDPGPRVPRSMIPAPMRGPRSPTCRHRATAWHWQPLTADYTRSVARMARHSAPSRRTILPRTPG